MMTQFVFALFIIYYGYNKVPVLLSIAPLITAAYLALASCT
jgi:hypothetical protein